jgi:hypothetical protein
MRAAGSHIVAPFFTVQDHEQVLGGTSLLIKNFFGKRLGSRGSFFAYLLYDSAFS